jgi:hypothetical protein
MPLAAQPATVTGELALAGLHVPRFKGEHHMADTWLPSLITATPQEGFELAITLSRRGVKYTQPDMETLKQLRPEYAQSADGLTAASQVIAINFQTVSAANNYWRG